MTLNNRTESDRPTDRLTDRLKVTPVAGLTVSDRVNAIFFFMCACACSGVYLTMSNPVQHCLSHEYQGFQTDIVGQIAVISDRVIVINC